MCPLTAISRLSALRSKLRSSSLSNVSSLLKSSSQPQVCASTKRISRISRLPVEMSCFLLTMAPLHTAIASARLQSDLTNDSKSWCLVPQGFNNLSTALMLNQISAMRIEKEHRQSAKLGVDCLV